MSYRENYAYGSSDDHENPQAWVIGVDKSESWSDHYRNQSANRELKELKIKHKKALLLLDKILEVNVFNEKQKEVVLKFIEDEIR